MANNFQYFVPTKVVFGKDTEKQTGELIKEFGGSRVLIHYGGGSVVRSGLLEVVKQSLQDAGISFVELGGVIPNPVISKVYEGIELCKKENVDFILAVGGGSVIDSAKGIAFGLAEDADVWEIYEHTRIAKASYPVGVVLTIAAAGSETSDCTVITNEETGKKRSYNSDLCRPVFAVMNPELTKTVSDFQTQCGCTDMMMHTMERYFTGNGNMEVTDAVSEGLLKTVRKYAQILHQDPCDAEARAEVLWAGSLMQSGLTGCGNKGGDFACHMLEHEMGGMFHVTHGAGLAAIWGTWARYVYKNCLPRFVRFAVNVMDVVPLETDEETALKGIEAMEDFYRSIDMPVNMRELGIEPTDEQCHEMAVRCAQATGGSKGSAMVLYQEDMEKIYKMAR